MARRGFLRAAAGTAVALPLALEATGALADPAATDPDQLFADGRFAAADRGYAGQIAADPGDAHAWAQRGYIAQLGNRFDAAQRFLRRALGLDSADQNSALRLADCYVRQDDFASAVPLFRQAGDRIDAACYAAVNGSPYQLAGQSAARLPFQTLDPLPTVDGAVNGSPLRFVLDTGATFGLSAAAAAAASVEPVATVMTLGPDGPVESYIGVAGSLTLGPIEVRNVPVMWNAGSLLDAPAGATGVLGTTIFYHFLTTMDYANRALALQRKTGAPPRGAGQTAPMWLAPDHFVFSRGRIGSGSGLTLLDTGGVGLGVVLSAEQAATDGVVPDYDDPGSYLGVTGYPCVADRVGLGPVERRGIPGVVGPFAAPADFGFGYTGTLSHEFFLPLSVTFDFTRMTVNIVRA
jgi:tetratricopeptide (TPR) repeat protein